MIGSRSADIDARIHSLVVALEANARLLTEAKDDLQRSEKAWRSHAALTVAGAGDDAHRSLRRARENIEGHADDARTKAHRLAAEAVAIMAPRYLAAGWRSEVWTDLPPSAPGECMRIGSTKIGRESLPVVLPLSAGVWGVSSSDADAFKVLVHNTITRALAAFDPTCLRVLTYDPELLLDLAVFSAVRPLSQSSVPPAITSTETFEKVLEGLVTDIATVDDRLMASAEESYWAALAARHAVAAMIPVRLLVIGADLRGLSERGRSRLAQVRKLAAKRGLLVIEMLTPHAEQRRPSGEASILINIAGAHATASTFPGVDWTPDPDAHDDFIRRLCSRLVDRPRKSFAPEVDFAEIVDRVEDPWMGEADEGLEAVIGESETGELTIRLRSENPPMPNILVGGAVGQGKSNLLLVLIHALAVRYSPTELEMVLVDLRDGVEFARLGPSAQSRSWLPHVRSLGLEFDPDFSVGVLHWVLNQMSDRSKWLKASGTTTLGDYRRATGKTLPRLLIVIDEFQRLFEGDDDQATQAASLIESIARTGRGFGVHLVLASQAITGIRGLAMKQDAIFSQFHNRISLRNTQAESQAFLGPHNLAATTLEHRGQVVVNDSLGVADHNRVGTIAYAKPNYLENLQTKLFSQGHRPEPPHVFRASSFATWPVGATTPVRSGGARITVGLPIAVEAKPREIALTRSPNQGLAVVGATRSLAVPVLVRATVTAAQSLGTRPRVLVLDGEGITSAPADWVGKLVDHLSSQGAVAERVEREDIAKKLIALHQHQASAELIVGIALDSVDLGMPLEPDYLMPNDCLRELLKTGPLHGTVTVGWWQSMSVLEEHLGYRAPGVRAWAFCGVSRDDLTSICGHGVHEPTAAPRFVWFDRAGGSGPERLVPFSAADITGIKDDDLA